MTASGVESPEADQNLLTDTTQASTMVQGADASQKGQNPEEFSTPVPTNVFTRTPQGTLGFTTSQLRILAEDVYDTEDTLLYWKFIKIRE